MNIAEHRLTIFHQLEELSEESLIEVEKLIVRLKIKQKSDDISDLGGFFEGKGVVLSDEELCKPVDFDEDADTIKLAKQRDSEIENGEVIALSHSDFIALESFLKPRIEAAERGEVINKSVLSIFTEVHEEEIQ